MDLRGHSWTTVTNPDPPTEIKLDKLEAVQKASCNANKGPGNVTWKESGKEIGLAWRREHWKGLCYSSYMWSREATVGRSSEPQMVQKEGEQPEQGWNRVNHDLSGETPCVAHHCSQNSLHLQGGQANPTDSWLSNLKPSLRKQDNKEKAGVDY